MNLEMAGFVLEQSGVIPDIPHLHMVSPKGHTVLNPAVPWYDRHVAEIARRFPKSSYAYHPELTRSGGAGLANWVYRNSVNLRFASVAATTTAVAVGALAAVIVTDIMIQNKTGESGPDLFTPEIQRYERSAFGSSRMI